MALWMNCADMRSTTSGRICLLPHAPSRRPLTVECWTGFSQKREKSKDEKNRDHCAVFSLFPSYCLLIGHALLQGSLRQALREVNLFLRCGRRKEHAKLLKVHGGRCLQLFLKVVHLNGERCELNVWRAIPLPFVHFSMARGLCSLLLSCCIQHDLGP